MIVAKSARLSSHIQQALIEQLLIFPFKDGTGEEIMWEVSMEPGKSRLEAGIFDPCRRTYSP